jgi:Holliday junction resolvase RusA-like endonuclease
MHYRIDIRGRPVPQGSLKQWTNKATGRTHTKYADNVYAWRAQVQQAVAAVVQQPLSGPVLLRLGFDLERPLSHYLPVNSRRTEPELRADAPQWPSVAPDTDKLVRAIADAITDAGGWKDDGQVAHLEAAKRYTCGIPGVLIYMEELNERTFECQSHS